MLRELIHRAIAELCMSRLAAQARKQVSSHYFFNGLAITSDDTHDQLLPSLNATAACTCLQTSIIGIPS